MTVLGLLVATAPAALADGHHGETRKVVQHHLDAFGSGDMKEMMADYSDESVIITPVGEVRGMAAIQSMFEGLFAEFAKPGASFSLQKFVVEGAVAYILWSAESADNVYEVGTDTFVVEDGKIAVQTFAAKVVPK